MFVLFVVSVMAVCTAAGDTLFWRPKEASGLPGLELRLSQKGLNYASGVAIDQLSADIRGKTLPNQHGEDHIKHLGKVKYDVIGMKITSFTKPTSSVTVSPGKGVTWSIANAGLSVDGDLKYEYKNKIFHHHGHSQFKVSVSGASMAVGVTLGKSADGHPTISSTSCRGTVAHVSIKFHHGSAWLLNLFRHKVEKPIRDKLQAMLCSSAQKGINEDAAKSLARMKVRVPVKKSPIIIDYRLVTAPVFAKGYIQTNHKGEFFFGPDQTEAPFSPKPMAQPATAQKMMTFCLSDYVMNTLGYVLNKRGLIKYTLRNTDLPASKRGFLNTTCTGIVCIGGMIKQLGKKFPNSSVELFMRTTSAPSLHTSPNDVTARFNGTVTFFVRLPNNTVTLGFDTKVVANISLTGQISLSNGSRITGKVKDISFNMTVTKSNVGPISDRYLNTILELAKLVFIIPKLNDVGMEGFPLPSLDVVKLVNPQSYILQETICFMTDVTYKPRLI